MTHKDLVRKAGAWLTNNRRCTVVLTELATQNNETPDAIGFFASGGASILVECKASRADFLADKNKIFRREQERGMGDHRYFLVPAKLITPDELPESWGLLEMHEKQIREVKKATYTAANKSAEVVMLVTGHENGENKSKPPLSQIVVEGVFVRSQKRFENE
jgi:hypothetical protein